MTDLLSKERLEKIAALETLVESDGTVIAINAYGAAKSIEVKQMAQELLQRREAAEKPAGWQARRAGSWFTVKQEDVWYYSDDGNTEIRKIFTEPPLTSAERERLAQQYRAEGIIFAANRMLAAWDAGFIDKPAADTLDVATMILSAVEMLKDATDGDFKRDFADEMLGFLRKEIKGEGKC